jgi:uncharacterized cupin superfamily protein
MNEVTVKTVGDVGYYSGPNAIAGIKFRHAGRDLGVTAWGMNVIEFAPDCPSYPEHDHAADGQEEVYIVLEGTATLHAGKRQWPLEAGTFVRVAPAVKRKLVPGSAGAIVLVLGGTPGKAYAPRG